MTAVTAIIAIARYDKLISSGLKTSFTELISVSVPVTRISAAIMRLARYSILP